jgi:hypothetical protein
VCGGDARIAAPSIPAALNFFTFDLLQRRGNDLLMRRIEKLGLVRQEIICRIGVAEANLCCQMTIHMRRNALRLLRLV